MVITLSVYSKCSQDLVGENVRLRSREMVRTVADSHNLQRESIVKQNVSIYLLLTRV